MKVDLPQGGLIYLRTLTKVKRKLMKRKNIKIWVVLFFAELLLIYLFYYNQPKCVPCPPDVFCPPCISKEQKIIRAFFLVPVLFGVVFLLKGKFKKIKIHRLFLLLAVIMFSCNIKHDSNCFHSQIGKYRFDWKMTLQQSGNPGKYKNDSLILSKFLIEFKADSTFIMNRKVDFFADSIGKWEPGNCGYESPGTLRYNGSPSIEQFGVCHETDSFFTKISPYDKTYGNIGLWFRKIQ